MLLPLALLALGVWIWWECYGRRRSYPPGPFPLPIIGNMGQIDMSAPHVWAIAQGKKYGGLFTTWLGSEATVWLTDKDLIKEVMTGKSAEAVSGRPYNAVFEIFTEGRNGRWWFVDGSKLHQHHPRQLQWSKEFLPCYIDVRHGIVGPEGWFWKDQRRFSIHVLRNLGLGRNIMETKIHSVVQDIIQNIDAAATEKAELCLDPHIDLCIGNIITELIMGIRFEKDSEFDDFKRILDQNFKLLVKPTAILLSKYPSLRFIPGPFKNDWKTLEHHRDVLRVLFRREMERHKTNPTPISEEPEDFIAAYYKEQAIREANGDNSFSELQLEACIGDFFVAGLETTATTLKWAVLYSLHNPAFTAKMQAEIREVCGTERLPSMSDKANLPLLGAYINETQRLANIAYINVPHSNTEDVKIRSWNIPKGTVIIPQVSAVHLDHNEFGEPNEFRPERFLDGHGALVTKNDGLNPFSIGKRQCAGEGLAKMELFLILGALMQRYNFRSPATGLPTLTPIVAFTLMPQPHSVRVISVDDQ